VVSPSPPRRPRAPTPVDPSISRAEKIVDPHPGLALFSVVRGRPTGAWGGSSTPDLRLKSATCSIPCRTPDPLTASTPRSCRSCTGLPRRTSVHRIIFDGNALQTSRFSSPERAPRLFIPHPVSPVVRFTGSTPGSFTHALPRFTAVTTPERCMRFRIHQVPLFPTSFRAGPFPHYIYSHQPCQLRSRHPNNQATLLLQRENHRQGRTIPRRGRKPGMVVFLHFLEDLYHALNP